MRRRLARRAQLVRARSRAKNEIHAVLMRCLKDRPPASDLFGVKGRRWLADQQLPLTEQETVDSAMRQVDFLDAEIAAVEKVIAAEALSWPEVKRLMTVPGVNVIVAATFMAAVGDIRRFGDRRKLTAYLGLDPRVRQSGAGPAAHGHISKQGSASARHALVEACWSTVRQPGPIAAFYARIKAKRGHSIAIVAAARKLACLFWCLLTRGEDYAFAQPSLTKKKMRRLELQAGAPRRQGGRGVWSTNEAMRKAERALALQAQRAYERTINDRQASTVTSPGRARHACASAMPIAWPPYTSLRPWALACASVCVMARFKVTRASSGASVTVSWLSTSKRSPATSGSPCGCASRSQSGTMKSSGASGLRPAALNAS